jgi:hypothetical protein
MKKVFMKLSGPAVLALAIALNSCNNAEETKKKVDEQNNQIQTQVDAKLNGLQDQVNMECTAMVDSMATARYNEWMATEGSKKGGKAAPKTKTKKEATKKPTDKKLDVGQKGTENTHKLNVGQKEDAPVNKKKLNVGQKP